MGTYDQQTVRLLDSYYSPLTQELARLRQRSEENQVPLILRETENFLVPYLRAKQPSHILEIGTAFGYSACLFATLLPHAEVTTIERSPYMIEEAKKTFADFSCADRIHMIEGEGSEILARLREERREPEKRFDFLFIDAAKSHYRDFLVDSEELLTENAVIVCDNILMHGLLTGDADDPGRRHRTSKKRMFEFLDYIKRREDLSVSLLRSGDGLAIIEFHDPTSH